jgi:hypothetical protein
MLLGPHEQSQEACATVLGGRSDERPQPKHSDGEMGKAMSNRVQPRSLLLITEVTTGLAAICLVPYLSAAHESRHSRDSAFFEYVNAPPARVSAWPQSQAEPNSPIDFLSRFSRNVDEEQILQWIERLGDNRYERRLEASTQLVAVGPAALSFLGVATRAADPEIARRATICIRQIEEQANWDLHVAAIRQLSRLDSPHAFQVLCDYLPYASFEPEVEENASGPTHHRFSRFAGV